MDSPMTLREILSAHTQNDRACNEDRAAQLAKYWISQGATLDSIAEIERAAAQARKMLAGRGPR